MQAKRRTTRRRKTTTHRAPTTHRRKTTHRRRRRMSEPGFNLSEVFNKTAAEHTGKAIVSGLAGAFIGTVLLKLCGASMKPIAKIGILGGAAFLSGTMLKMPNFGVGVASVGLIDAMGEFVPKGMSEPYLNEDELYSLPKVLSEPYLNDPGYLSAPYM